MRTEQTVQCDLPGLEGVSATYNMLASETEFNRFEMTFGAEERERTLVRVEGYEGDPLGEDAPVALRKWLARVGLRQAFTEYLTDPN
jgi:hypothetical protein